jgi:hypothetical protein
MSFEILDNSHPPSEWSNGEENFFPSSKFGPILGTPMSFLIHNNRDVNYSFIKW